MGTRKGETDILQGFHVKLTPMSFCFTPTHLGSLSLGKTLNLTRV